MRRMLKRQESLMFLRLLGQERLIGERQLQREYLCRLEPIGMSIRQL
jgi:hypothetical protein